ncbi:sigma-70 family RNA polymerase sigma factor [Actibacterium sp. D379-3]
MPLLDEIEANIPALRRYARGLTGDRDTADDLVQDCLERAVAKRHLWRRDGPVRAWLFRILLNRHRDTLRRRPRQLVAVADLATEPARPGGQEAHMALSEVQTAIATLPVDQREALLLVALEGMSFDEAARTLGIPTGTLMSRLGRAREKLRVMTGRERPARPTPERRNP